MTTAPPLAPRVLEEIEQGVISRAVISSHSPWMRELDGGCVGQRPFHRSRISIRLIVAGRQSGKTHAAAEEVVRLILKRPGCQSCLLMPTYKSTKPTIRHLRRAFEVAPGVVWREQDKVFVLPGGAELFVRTADDKTGVPTRGLTLDGVLWVDEASYVPRSAWEAAQDTLSAVQDPRVIATTTARGRKNSWVFDLAQEAGDEPDVEFFRFRTTDSPHHNPRWVAKTRKRLGNRRAQEEHDAVFLGDSQTPFQPEDIERLFASSRLPRRGRQLSIGIDFGKEQKYTVAILMNEFGEAWVLGRWRHRKWPETQRRIEQYAVETGAICVLDSGSAGGGGVLADYLSADGSVGEAKVLLVNTGSIGTKGKLLQQLEADIEHGRLQVDSAGELSAQLRHELTFFPPPVRRAKHGREILVYEGVEDGEDAFDDCVIALALANEGRINGWEGDDPLGGDFTGFLNDDGSGGAGFGFGAGPDLGYSW